MAGGGLLQRLRGSLRSAIPRRAIVGAGLLNVFLRKRCQTSRNAAGMCVDAAGEPVPWITYPAADYLDSLELSGIRVFEYGMGASTAYFSRRGCSVIGVEMEPDWHARLIALKLPGVECRLCTDGGQYPREIDACEGPFDLILIDGAERYRSAQQAHSRLAPGGLLLLDNSEWYPRTASMLREAGLLQIEFAGFGPLNAFPSVTSLFFREPVRLAYRAKPKGWHPVGGRALSGGALDDKP